MRRMQGTHAVILQKQTEIKARVHNVAYAKAYSCKGYNILILTNAKSTGKNKNAKTISILWQRKTNRIFLKKDWNFMTYTHNNLK